MKKTIASLAALIALSSITNYAGIQTIDTFDRPVNLIGGTHNCYQAAPSKAVAKIQADKTDEEGVVANKYLKIRFDKANKGGKYGSGGWCGWYTLFYQPKDEKPEYLEITDKQEIVFKVRGVKGDENFRVTLKDRQGEIDDAAPLPVDIGRFLPSGRVTKEWQEARIPLDMFTLNRKEVASFSINFERDCYPSGSASGTIFIDDLVFE